MNSFNLNAFAKAYGNSPEPGTPYPSICNRLADCGTQINNYMGKVTELPKIWVSFECHSPDGEMFTHNQFFTASTNTKAALRKRLDEWHGSPLTREQCKTIDASWMLGRVGILTLDYANEIDDRMTIKSMKPAPEGMEIPEQKYPNVLFSLAAPDLDMFMKLPSGVQEMIKKSPEWQALPFAHNWNAEQLRRQLARVKELNAEQQPF